MGSTNRRELTASSVIAEHIKRGETIVVPSLRVLENCLEITVGGMSLKCTFGSPTTRSLLL